MQPKAEISSAMDRAALKRRLDDMKIKETEYSLYNELISDRIILFHNYNKWEVFYLDERGKRNDEKVFLNEGQACDYIYELFMQSQKMTNRFGLN